MKQNIYNIQQELESELEPELETRLGFELERLVSTLIEIGDSIVRNFEHPRNAPGSTCRSFELAGIKTVVNWRQFENVPLSIFLTEDGISIVLRAHPPNALSPISFTEEGISTHFNSRQLQNAYFPMNWRVDGRAIDVNRAQPRNADSPIVVNLMFGMNLT